MTAPDHPYRLIVFDVDGTLVDSQAGIVAAMAHAFREVGLAEPSPDRVRRVVGLSLEEAVSRLLPADAPDDLLAAAAGAYRSHYLALRSRPDHHEPLFPGTREVLARLDTPRVCLGIATGKNLRGLHATLARHGLARHFVTLQTADGGPGKPHPRMLQAAMADIGARPEETVLIGDTVYDIQMAGHAGTAALGVAWGYHPPAELAEAGAQRVLSHFDELPAALAELAEGAR